VMYRPGLTTEQQEVLLKPLANGRVAKRKQAGRELSYLEAWDVRAHLNRVFGFGQWSADTTETRLAFEEEVVGSGGKQMWSVGYSVTLTLHIHATGATYTETAVGSASLPMRGEAHDMAVKSGASDALKRAATNLGTQFGLSLYDNGRVTDVVGHTLIGPSEDSTGTVEDLQDHAERMAIRIKESADKEALREVWETVKDLGVCDHVVNGVSLRDRVNRALEGM